MPPKRRGAQAKSAPPAQKLDPPKQQPPTKSVSVQPPPPPPPPEPGATRVRKEWTKFIDAWYEPQKKKLVEKLQKDLLVKYKNLGSVKETQKLREMELFERLDAIAQQLAQPARAEWERRLDLAQLREDQWDDMSGEEQHAVMSVFVGFFADDVEDMDDDDDLSAEPCSIEKQDSVVEEHPHRSIPSHPIPSRQTIPPTPTRQTFECVNPTSFFPDSMTPPNQTKNLPALSMDHLATLGPANAGRPAEPVSASVSVMPGFQNWASEAGIVTQQPPSQPVKPPVPSTSVPQSLSARPRATDNISRQPSAASTSSSSPPMKSSSPQYSPPNQTTKFSPPINAENLPLGKRYIGPTILEEEPDPMDESLLKSKMADEYQQYKISLRIQMIYQFHAEAAEVEIKLFETLLADEGTKESRARAVQEHETSMMRLREQKEEERKRLCAEEREKRRQEMRQHLAQRRPPHNREIDPGQKAPPKPMPDKAPSIQPRQGKVTHQKENVPLAQPPAIASSSSKLEPPGSIKKSNSMLSQDEVSANETLFANAMAAMRSETSAPVLTPAQASLNEALFSNAASMLAAHGQSTGTSKNTAQPPSIMKKSNSARSQEHGVPAINVSFAEPPAPEPTQVPATTAKGKKGKKGPIAQAMPAKPIPIAEEEMVMGVELPTPGPSLWDAATNVARNVWGAASTSLSESKAKPSASAEERSPDPEPSLLTTLASSKGNANANAKKTTMTAPAKKGKKVTIMEEPDVDADPIVSPPSVQAKTKGAWGSVNGKGKAVPAVVEESEAELVATPPISTPAPAPPPAAMSARGKKTTGASKSAQKPQLKVAVSEVGEKASQPGPVPVPTGTNKTKLAWDVPMASTSAQGGKRVTQSQPQPQPPHQPPPVLRHGATSAGSRVRVDVVPEAGDLPGPSTGGRAMWGPSASVNVVEEDEEEEEEDDEGDANAWFKPENLSYWASFMAGSPEAETQAVPRAGTVEAEVANVAEPVTSGKHVRWTPTVSGESDEEDGFEDGEAELATNVWVQYAISGGDVPGLGGAPEEPRGTTTPFEQRDAGVWDQGRAKKPMMRPTTGDVGNRAQPTSVFDRAALAGQWPKMESWLSPASRGQNSGSARVF